MNRMVCEDCSSVFYSAAARTLVENGERCETCGGRLRLEPEAKPAERVGVGAERERGTGPQRPARDGTRRFERGPDDGSA